MGRVAFALHTVNVMLVPIGGLLQRLRHIRRQAGVLSGDCVPAARSIQVNMDRAHLVAYGLALDNASRGPETRRNGQVLKKADFDVRCDKTLVFDRTRFN